MTRTPRPLRWLDRCLSPRDPTGRLCPQPVITAGHHEARLDTLLGDGWALLTDGRADAPAGVRHVDISAFGPAGTASRFVRSC